MIAGRVIRTESEESLDELQKRVSGNIIIKAEEMKAIVEDWNLQGCGDLRVDESLLKRLTEYVEYRGKLIDTLDKLLTQEFERYLVGAGVELCSKYDIVTSDGKYLLAADMYAYETAYADEDYEQLANCASIIDVSNFKCLLSALGNKIISYMKIPGDDLIDLKLCLKGYGIELKPKTTKSGEIVLQLILPKKEKQKND